MVTAHSQAEVVKLLLIPFDEFMKPVNLSGIYGLDQIKIFIFDFPVIRILGCGHFCLSPDKNHSVRWVLRV
jgi:hypothetical protein